MHSILKAAILSAALASVATCAAAQGLQRTSGEPTNAGPVAREILLARQGLNMSAAADADVFLTRLTTAITRDCDTQPNLAAKGEDRTQAFRACREGALREAIERVGSPMVRRRFTELRVIPQFSLASR